MKASVRLIVAQNMSSFILNWQRLCEEMLHFRNNHTYLDVNTAVISTQATTLNEEYSYSNTHQVVQHHI